MPRTSANLHPHVRRLLAGLRWRIRLYIWLEGLFVALLWLGMTFWASLAIDYLPVLVGASELPLATRAILLTAISLTLGFILYRWILRRTFVQLADRSMAVLLERKYENFQDRLVTAVEMHNRPDHAEEFSEELLEQTSNEVREHLDQVKLHRIFNKAALLKRFLLACLLIMPMGALAAFDSSWTYQPSNEYTSALELGMRRLYLLDNSPWPRKAKIQVVGIELVRTNTGNTSIELETQKIFDKNRTVKIGRGANLKLLVHADRSKTVPKECVIHYRTEDGVAGRRKMIKQGSTSGDFQLFVFDDKPLKGILTSLRFDVIGFDARVRDYHIQVVDNPAIIETTLDYQFPRYIDKLPVKGEDWIKGKSLPLGSNLDIHFKSNKSLRQVHLFNLFQEDQAGNSNPTASEKTTANDHTVIQLVHVADQKRDQQIPLAIAMVGTTTDPETERPVQVDLPALVELRDPETQKPLKWTLQDDGLFILEDGNKQTPVTAPAQVLAQDIRTRQWLPATAILASQSGTQFNYRTESLHRNLALDILLVDQDGVVSERPHRVSLAAKRDTTPVVEIAVKGIGSAVTPDVVIPIDGAVKDDYGVASNWFQVQVGENEPERFDFKLQSEQKIASRLDFREIRSQEDGLELTPGQRLVLTVHSADHYDLEGDPNVGSSSPLTLDIVTPDQLLSLLERRELATRQRYELIIEEVTVMKDSLERVAEESQGLDDPSAGEEPEDKQPDNDEAAGGNKKLTAEEKRKRAQSLRLLRVQRALLQSQKSAQEILGVATTFDDIREELVNNRIDTADRKSRLQEQISQPLFRIARESFPQLDQRLKDLQPLIGQTNREPQAALDALTQAVDILQQMDEVLQKMLELETYNELIDLVRSLIQEQAEIQEKTRKERKKQLLDLLK